MSKKKKKEKFKGSLAHARVRLKTDTKQLDRLSVLHILTINIRLEIQLVTLYIGRRFTTEGKSFCEVKNNFITWRLRKWRYYYFKSNCVIKPRNNSISPKKQNVKRAYAPRTLR